MMTLGKFLRDLEMIASKRPGDFTVDTKVSEVVSPHAIGPQSFFLFLLNRFDVSAEYLGSMSFMGGQRSLESLYTELSNTTIEA